MTTPQLPKEDTDELFSFINHLIDERAEDLARSNPDAIVEHYNKATKAKALQLIESYTLQRSREALSNVETDDDGHTWYIGDGIEMRLDEYLAELKQQQSELT